MATIREAGGQLTIDAIAGTRVAGAAEWDAKALARAIWGLGDYHRFATALVWELRPVLVAACRIGPGHRVLDVAAGTGNVAIRAAEAGAQATALDLVPEHLDAGRREAVPVA